MSLTCCPWTGGCCPFPYGFCWRMPGAGSPWVGESRIGREWGVLMATAPPSEAAGPPPSPSEDPHPSFHASLHLSASPDISPPIPPSCHCTFPSLHPSLPASLHPLSIPPCIPPSPPCPVSPLHLPPPQHWVSPQIQELPPCFLIESHGGAGRLGGAHVPAVVCRRRRMEMSPTAPRMGAGGCRGPCVPPSLAGGGRVVVVGAHLRCAAGARRRGGRSRASCRSCGRIWARGCPPAPPGTRRW